jgi:hypothetical protein
MASRNTRGLCNVQVIHQHCGSGPITSIKMNHVLLDAPTIAVVLVTISED